ncbi:MAG TPA: aminotransferase class V-fold PLP-dependent enzyme, partial [Bacilli bacterium]|nr:aminotransferase class V-fold PLP-dependent enzyme [Bacilli bacterium]
MLDVEKIKRDIPLFQNYPNLIYLDSCATTLKPRYVLDKMDEYYQEYGVNIHRGVYELSYRATEEYDKARKKIAKFINASFEEVIFTRGTTNSLNMIAQTYGMATINPND